MVPFPAEGRAARLLAASEAMGRNLGETPSRKEQEETARLCDRLLAEPGPEACACEESIGATWTERVAVVFALQPAPAMN